MKNSVCVWFNHLLEICKQTQCILYTLPIRQSTNVHNSVPYNVLSIQREVSRIRYPDYFFSSGQYWMCKWVWVFYAPTTSSSYFIFKITWMGEGGISVVQQLYLLFVWYCHSIHIRLMSWFEPFCLYMVFLLAPTNVQFFSSTFFCGKSVGYVRSVNDCKQYLQFSSLQISLFIFSSLSLFISL